VISGLGGIGAAAGPLIGGLIATAISWRAAFVFQALVVATIIVLSRRMVDPLPADPTRPFDVLGAILSAVGMFFIVLGILQADSNPALMAVLLAVGAAFLICFFLYIRSRERAGKEPLLSTGLFKNRVSNLALATQNAQWLILLGTSFVVAVYLQTVRGYNPIETGAIFTAATLGVLASSLAAERLAKKRAQKSLIVAGFVVTLAGIGLLIGLVWAWSSVVAFVPGLLLIGLGVGVMLTPSVNVVQSSFPDELQGEISGLSRSVSNLGSSFGTAIAGTILVADLAKGTYALGMASPPSSRYSAFSRRCPSLRRLSRNRLSRLDDRCRRDRTAGTGDRRHPRPAHAGVGPVPDDAGQLGDERLDRDGREGRGYDRDRNSGGDHGVHARDGGADDHGSQDRRDHRAEARLRDRLHHLRQRLVHHLDRPEPSGPALRLVVPRGRRRGTDPAGDRRSGRGELPARASPGRLRARRRRWGGCGRDRPADRGLLHDVFLLAVGPGRSSSCC
jgi:MFS family permease